MTDPSRWTQVEGIRAVVRRSWTDGTLLRAWVAGEPFGSIEIPLRGPVAADLGEHYEDARGWADAIYRGAHDGHHYAVAQGSIGGRLAGRTSVPVRAIVTEFAQAWSLLRVDAEARAFRDIVAQAGVGAVHVAARDWALAHPVQAIALAGVWPRMLVAVAWLDTHRGSELYLRQVTAPDVDTKFIEQHRSVLAAMLGVPPRRFAQALGFSDKPATVRLRFDPALFGLPGSLTEGVFRVEELRALSVRPRLALIVENEISYLSVPVVPGGVVLWGKGYSVDDPASLEWLTDTEVLYWGDLDTHGFAILDRARAHLPRARSVLMDRETLLAHETRWGRESTPTSAALTRLDAPERALYLDLVGDRYAPAVRLEQERIDWEWARQRLAEAGVRG